MRRVAGRRVALAEREGTRDMLRRLELLGFALVAHTFALACEKSDPTPPATNPAMAGSSSGTGGGATAGGSDAGGAPDDDSVRKGERGSSCDSTNDCADDLSCVVTQDCPVGVSCANKSCQPSNFGLIGTGNRCYVHECSTKADCCGEMPETAPAKCDKRTSICNTPTLLGCTATLCTSDATCGPGTCNPAVCSLSGGSCMTTTDCALNTCDTSTMLCTVSQTDCSVSACVSNLCPTRICNCQNPEYMPTAAICSDPDCEGICGFTCQEERCVVDTRCTADAQCGATTPFCDDGACVACRTSEDCEDEECVNGQCGPECETDTQCKLFEACQANECVYVGCRTDRECVLQAGAAPSGQDPRLAKCQIEEGQGTCVFPCEIDAQCAPSEVCLEGMCEYIGCETDTECKTIAGLHNLPEPSPERPWVTSVQCRPESAAAP
jgi:hypothetical protein